MAFPKLSAAGEDTGGSFQKPAEHESRIDSSGAHYPDGPQIRRILIARNTGRVCRGITTPVA